MAFLLQVEGARARISDLDRQLREARREGEQREASRNRTEALLEDLRQHMRHDCRTAQGWLRKELQSQVCGLSHAADAHMTFLAR